MKTLNNIIVNGMISQDNYRTYAQHLIDTSNEYQGVINNIQVIPNQAIKLSVVFDLSNVGAVSEYSLPTLLDYDASSLTVRYVRGLNSIVLLASIPMDILISEDKKIGYINQNDVFVTQKMNSNLF